MKGSVAEVQPEGAVMLIKRGVKPQGQVKAILGYATPELPKAPSWALDAAVGRSQSITHSSED